MNYRVEPSQIGNYVIPRREPLGRGNFAVVRLAKHALVKSRVALKMIDTQQCDPDVVDKFVREARLMRSLNHPHIVKLYEVFNFKHLYCMALEYASKGEVFYHLKKCIRLNEGDARRAFRQVVSAVAYCHARGVVHRDLKAENLLLDSEMNVKLCDFGFGNEFRAGEELKTTCGSPPYAAPELFQGLEYDGTRSDIWSLGIMLFIFVTGAYPFHGDSMQVLQSEVLRGHINIPFYVSPECSDLIVKILQVQPSRRLTMAQIVQHRWFHTDWSEELEGLFGYSLTGGGLGPPPHQHRAATTTSHDSHEAVLGYMRDKGLPTDGVQQLSTHPDPDPPVEPSQLAVYHLLMDKLRRHRAAWRLGHLAHRPHHQSMVPQHAGGQGGGRRNSRGCISTGEGESGLGVCLTSSVPSTDGQAPTAPGGLAPDPPGTPTPSSEHGSTTCRGPGWWAEEFQGMHLYWGR